MHTADTGYTEIQHKCKKTTTNNKKEQNCNPKYSFAAPGEGANSFGPKAGRRGVWLRWSSKGTPEDVFFASRRCWVRCSGSGWMTSSYWPTSRRETARRRSGRTSRPRSRRSGARCGSFVPDDDEERLTDSEDEPVKRASPTSVPNCGRFANV